MDNQTTTLNARESSDSSVSTLNLVGENGFENGSFETGDFQGWNTIGDTSIETDSLGIFPSDGEYQALITTGDSDAGGSVVDGDLEEFLDLPSGSLDNLVGGDATEGSVIKQTFTVEAGDVVSFDWNFLTNESTPNNTFNDTAFLSVNGFTFELADTEANFVDATNVDEYAEQTDTQTLNFSIATAGTYTIGFGVVDVGDEIVDSGLVIDNLDIQSLDNIQALTTSGSADQDLSTDLTFGEGGFTSTNDGAVNDSVSGLVFGENGFEAV